MKAGLGGAAVVILLAVSLWAFENYRQQTRETAPMLPVTFAHADHTSVNCIACHHNFIDQTGQGLCFDCHQNHPDVRGLREVQFHSLCRDCHAQRQADGDEVGPLRSCEGCHLADDAP